MTLSPDDTPVDLDPEQLLDRCRDRLRWMVRLRLDPRVRGRVDESDVLQETIAEVARRLPYYEAQVRMPFYLWARQIAAQKLIDIHRRHFAGRRDVRDEAPAALSGVSALELSQVLAGRGDSPPTAALRDELRQRVQDALESLDELDREMLALRHLEQLSNAEAAEVLGLSESAASRAFVRAVRRMREILGDALDGR